MRKADIQRCDLLHPDALAAAGYKRSAYADAVPLRQRQVALAERFLHAVTGAAAGCRQYLLQIAP